MSVDKMSVKTKTKFQKLLAKIAGYEESVEPKTKEQKLLNEIAESGGSSGGGGGANVLTLYIGTDDRVTPWAYKNPERNAEYETYDEARTAIVNASSIKLFADDNTIVFPLFASAQYTPETQTRTVSVTALNNGEPMPITLFSGSGPK